MSDNRVKIGQSRMFFYPDPNETILHQQFEHVVFDLPSDLPRAVVQLIHTLLSGPDGAQVFPASPWQILPVLTPKCHHQLYEHGVGFCMGCGAVWFAGPYSRQAPFFCDQACAYCFSSVFAGISPHGAPGGRSYGQRPPGQASEMERLHGVLARHFRHPSEKEANQAPV